MTRGLPNFKDALTRPSGNQKSDTRDLSPPKVQKVKIESLDIPFRSEVTDLLLNPESITETKSANWIQQQVPGQSDPLLQWISGSERVVSFSALVTRDLASNPTLSSTTTTERVTLIESDSATAGLEITNPINTTEANILSGLSQQDILRGQTTQERSLTWLKSIQTNLDYYRSLLAPRKSNRRFQVKTPPLIRLTMGDILGNRKTVARQRWIMLSYDINITKFTPDLRPTEAIVSFTFIEYVDRSKTVDVESINKQLDANSAKNINVTNVDITTTTRDSINQALDRF